MARSIRAVKKFCHPRIIFVIDFGILGIIFADSRPTFKLISCNDIPNARLIFFTALWIFLCLEVVVVQGKSLSFSQVLPLMYSLKKNFRCSFIGTFYLQVIVKFVVILFEFDEKIFVTSLNTSTLETVNRSARAKQGHRQCRALKA